MSNNFELLHVVLALPSTNPINIISIYRPPNSSVSEFFAEFSNFLNNITYNLHPLVIMGDLNIDVFKCSSNATSQLTNMLCDYGLSIIGNTPTRVCMTSSTHIDLVICNSLAKSYIQVV